MSAVRPTLETAHPAAVPWLLVELPSRRQVFFDNLRDMLFPRRLEPLDLRSAPAPFWHDVFVERPLPWDRFWQSGILHVIGGAAVIGLAHLLALQPRVVQTATFDHSQVLYYQASEYLPPLDTRSESSAKAAKVDPEVSKQPVISVPRESDNRSQTIVTPPKVRLKRDVAFPNIVAWSDTPQKPRLAIPPAPLSPAAEITRLAPNLDSVVAPPSEAAHLDRRRNVPTLQDPVAAPPTDLRTANAPVQNLQPALVAPPPNLDAAAARRPGDMNIAPSPVVAPAPQLAVAPRRTYAGAQLGAQVVAPPQPLPASGSSGASSGSPGRMIALSLHPAVNAPADPPAGNRRGTFAATPDGHAGASGSPGTKSGTAASGSSSAGAGNKGNGGAAASNGAGELPSGLYVGAAGKPSAVAGNPAGSTTAATTVNPKLLASVQPPRVSTARPMQPDSAAKLTEPERAIFGNRRFYSVTLNMPNLNSAGGSWVIRFAELKHDSGNHDASAPAEDISQPMATRKVDPAYPLQLMKENVHGTVILYAVIHADGTVGNVRVLRGVDDRLDRFASEAIAQWKFDPATRNGAPVDVEATFQIPFRPPRLGSNF
jgi:TonB family protein